MSSQIAISMQNLPAIVTVLKCINNFFATFSISINQCRSQFDLSDESFSLHIFVKHVFIAW